MLIIEEKKIWKKLPKKWVKKGPRVCIFVRVYVVFENMKIVTKNFLEEVCQ